MFQVVIQLGAILAVVALFWRKLWPFGRGEGGRAALRRDKVELWGKILLACVPAAIVGLLFDELFERLFYNYVCVAIALIAFGVAFIAVENAHRGRKPRIRSLARLDVRTVLLIGLFQVIAAIFPGTSRSGATIIGALMLGVSRRVAAEFTFYLAIPVMFGASLLKLVRFGFAFTGMEIAILLIGMAVAFVVSVLVIRFLMDYIKRHDFKVFGLVPHRAGRGGARLFLAARIARRLRFQKKAAAAKRLRQPLCASAAGERDAMCPHGLENGGRGAVPGSVLQGNGGATGLPRGKGAVRRSICRACDGRRPDALADEKRGKSARHSAETPASAMKKRRLRPCAAVNSCRRR